MNTKKGRLMHFLLSDAEKEALYLIFGSSLSAGIGTGSFFVALSVFIGLCAIVGIMEAYSNKIIERIQDLGK